MARSRSRWRSAGAILFMCGRYFSTISVPGVFFTAVVALSAFTDSLSNNACVMSNPTQDAGCDLRPSASDRTTTEGDWHTIDTDAAPRGSGAA